MGAISVAIIMLVVTLVAGRSSLRWFYPVVPLPPDQIIVCLPNEVDTTKKINAAIAELPAHGIIEFQGVCRVRSSIRIPTGKGITLQDGVFVGTSDVISIVVEEKP